MTTSSLQNTLEAYEKAWAQTDVSKRLRLLSRCLSPDFVYTDPNVQVTGYDQFSGYMAELQSQIPGVHFVTTEFKTHHDRILIHWNMLAGSSHVRGVGASYLVVGSDGRLTQMNGFFDSPGA